MKQICCLFLLAIVCMQGYAQKAKDYQLTVLDGLIDFQYGLAVPVLDFADKNFKLASGYASTGYNVKLGMSYDFSSILGFCFQYQYIENPFDSEKFLADLKASDKTTTFNSFTSDPWKLNGAMVGLYMPIKNNRLSTDIRFLVGIFSGTLPQNTVNFTPTGSATNYSVVQSESSSTDYAYQGGVKLRYQLYENLMLVGSADFTYTEIEYKNLRATFNPPYVSIPLDNYKQYYHIVNVSVGIGYQFK